MANRWLATDRGTADEYDRRFLEGERAGQDVHGEASFVASLGVRSVLDAGCGTGRVAIELARRGVDVAGVDLDPDMLTGARRKAPHLPWLLADLRDVDVRGEGEERRRFEAVVLAGNVMIFLEPGTEAEVVANLARHLLPGGALVAGFQLDGRLTLAEYDGHCAAAGLVLAERWATWDRAPWREGGDYAVSVHRARGAPAEGSDDAVSVHRGAGAPAEGSDDAVSVHRAAGAPAEGSDTARPGPGASPAGSGA